jgi:hypothetical protein
MRIVRVARREGPAFGVLQRGDPVTIDGAEVRAHTRVSFNGRPYTQLVDPTVDLSEKSPFWIGRADWILEYDIPLPDSDRYQDD